MTITVQYELMISDTLVQISEDYRIGPVSNLIELVAMRLAAHANNRVLGLLLDDEPGFGGDLAVNLLNAIGIMDRRLEIHPQDQVMVARRAETKVQLLDTL